MILWICSRDVLDDSNRKTVVDCIYRILDIEVLGLDEYRMTGTLAVCQCRNQGGCKITWIYRVQIIIGSTVNCALL